MREDLEAETKHATISEASKLTTMAVERRERGPVSMPAFAVLEDGSTHEILLLDLSSEGCGIETPVELRPGQRLKLSVLRRGAIDAQVRWCSGGKAGLVFSPEASTKQPQPRQSARVALSADIRIRRLGKSTFRVSVFDASPYGCRIDLVDRPVVGECVLIKFAGLETMDAEVCWVEQFMAGLRFRKPMHPAVFELLIERLKG